MTHENTHSDSRKKGLIIALVALLVGATGIGIGFIANSGSTAPETPISSPTPTPTTPVEETPVIDFTACALVSPNEGDPFDDALVAGLDQVKKDLNISGNVYAADDVKARVDSAVSDGCGVIFIASLQLAYEIAGIAANYPEVNFVTFDSSEETNLPNVKVVSYDMSQSSFLAGYLAAAQSNTKIVGTFGGFNLPVTAQYMDSFFNGALAYGADNDVEVKVVGWNPNTQSGAFIETFAPNSPEAADIVNQMVAAGVDVIFPIAGSQYDVIIDAYTREGVQGLIIGVDIDLAVAYPEYAPYVLTSVEKIFSQPLSDIVADLVAGEQFTADPYLATMTNGGTGLSAFYEFDSQVSEDITNQLREVEADIINGERSTRP